MKRKRGWSASEALERSRAKRGYRSRTKDMHHIEWGRSRRGLETGRRGTTGTGPVEMEEAPRTTMACAASLMQHDAIPARTRASARGLKKTGRWFLDTISNSPNFSLNILEDRLYLKTVPGIIFIH